MIDQFFADVMPRRDGEFYTLFPLSTKQHKFYDTFDSFIEAIHEVQGKRDWYFGTAVSEQDKRDKNLATAIRSLRIDIDAGEDKFDPDNPAKAYKNRDTALAALVSFIKATGLVPTYIVSSGHGLHVYWALVEDCTELDDWDFSSRLLGAACREKGLHADPAVTTDRVRVLRIPGTIHGKTGNEVKILRATGKKWDLGAITDRLRAIAPDVQKSATKAVSVANSAAARLAEEAGITTTPPTYISSYAKAEKECAALSLYKTKRLDYPVWMLTIQSAKISQEGRELAHSISKQNADQFGGSYSFDEVENKLDSLTADFVKCDSFAAQCPECKTCKHYGKIRGPKELGKLTSKDMTMEQAAAAFQAVEEQAIKEGKKKEWADSEGVTLPSNFPSVQDRSGDGKAKYIIIPGGSKHNLRVAAVVKVQTEDADGALTHREMLIPVFNTPFYFSAWAAVAEGGGSMKLQLSVLDRNSGAWIMSPLDPKLTASTSEMLQHLAARGIGLADTSSKVLSLARQYILNIFNAIQNKAARPAPRYGFGFNVNNDGSLSYIQGRVAVTKGLKLLSSLLPSQLDRHAPAFVCRALPQNFEAMPTKEAWASIWRGAKEHAGLLQEGYGDYPEYYFVAMLIIGSIYFGFAQDSSPTKELGIPPGGMALSLYSRSSGFGKSSLLKLAAAAYYNMAGIAAATGSMKSGGSHKARIKNFVDMGSLPTMSDEITGITPEQVSALLYSIAQGRDVVRLVRDGSGLQDQATFSNLIVFSTNAPMRELLRHKSDSNDAEQLRILEVNFGALDPATQMPPGVTDTPEGAQIGAEFGSKVTARVDPNIGCIGLLLGAYAVSSGIDRMYDEVQRVRQEIMPEIGLVTKERFFARAFAAMLVARDVLERQRVPVPSRDMLIAQARKMIEYTRKDMAAYARTPVQMMEQMFMDLQPDMLITKRDSFPSHSADAIVIQRPIRTIKGRVTLNGRWLITYEAMRVWCRDNNVVMSELVDEIVKNNWAAPLNGAVGFADRVTINAGLPDMPQQVRAKAILINTSSMWETVDDGDVATGRPLSVVPVGGQGEQGSAAA